MAKQTFTTGQVLTAAQMTSLQQTAMSGGAASAKTASYTLVAADAGSAISMSNASATTITVNTALFAAGDTVHITNLGAGVTTITAGTATVNSSASLALAQYESGFLDFTSASAAIFVKGAGAAASAGGLTLINTTSFTGVASQSINDVFSATYTNYRIMVNSAVSTSADRVISMRMRVGGSDFTTALYRTQSMGMNAAGTTVNSANSSATSLVLQTNVYYTSFLFAASLDIASPFASTNTNFVGASTGGTAAVSLGLNLNCQIEDSTSFTGFTLLNSVGNFTSGTVSVYGYNK